MFEMKLDNKNGVVWDISNIVGEITWKTSRIGKPGSLEFTLVKNAIFQDPVFQYNNGDIVSLAVDGQNVFYGYIFTIDSGRDEGVKITAYDQIRYLLSNDTKTFKDVTAADVLRQIAVDLKLQVGQVEDTVYRIPTLVEDNQTYLDIINKALTLTLINKNLNFVLFDDYGSLSLRNTQSLLPDIIIGDESLLFDFGYSKSIDTDTYNRVKLYRNNQATGKREVYPVENSATMARWGTLQLNQSVDENLNEAQINERLTTLLTLKNRESKTLKIDAIGDIRVRAGSYVRIQIKEFGINQPFLVDECSHSFDVGDHTMNLELKVI